MAMTIIYLVFFIGIMYFMLIRPQKKRDKLTKQMLDGLVVGDKILTIGGIIGKLIAIKDDNIYLETGKAGQLTTICFKRSAVSEVLKAAPESKEQYEDQYAIPTDDNSKKENKQ